MLLKVSVPSPGGGEALLLDIGSIAVQGTITSGYAYYLIISWTCFCMGIFLVKTVKRTDLLSEVTSYGSSKHRYISLALHCFDAFLTDVLPPPQDCFDTCRPSMLFQSGDDKTTILALNWISLRLV
ncbi:hypothetical protein Peur_011937 [Populus x canadensis]